MMEDTKNLKIVVDRSCDAPTVTYDVSNGYVAIDGYVCVFAGCVDGDDIVHATSTYVLVMWDVDDVPALATTHPVNCMTMYSDYNSCKIAALQQQIDMMKEEFASFISGYNEMRSAHQLY
jgi:hypothetical protein